VFSGQIPEGDQAEAWAEVERVFGTDFHAEFFNDWLRFIGVADVSEIRFQPTVLTADPDAARDAALARAGELGAELAAPAAEAA
jgi:FMN-dependent NADH-azoreductase